MADVLVKKRERKNDSVWEYRFEIAPIDGKDNGLAKAVLKRKVPSKKQVNKHKNFTSKPVLPQNQPICPLPIF